MTRSMKLQPDDGTRYSLGIIPSSDDVVGSHRKFARRFAEGIGKLVGNAKRDRWKEDRRTCRKIARGCRSMQEVLIELDLEGTQINSMRQSNPLLGLIELRSVDQRAGQRKSQAGIRKVEGNTFTEISTGKPSVSGAVGPLVPQNPGDGQQLSAGKLSRWQVNRMYHRIWAVANY
ncbi:hypothetical protein GW17_00018942 [Ensete ventricosum]|nr:hypothetical protein GW17_00018942 [Ensete ventricosum]